MAKKAISKASNSNLQSFYTVVDDLIGNEYERVEVIGRGKNAITLKLKSRKDESSYCFKTIKPEITDPVERKRIGETLEKEFKILRPLSHKCLPRIFDANFTTSLPYYICSYHPGETFAQFRKNERRLAIEESIVVINSLMDVFRYLHDNGRTHCDAHQDNILISEAIFADGILLIDFGSGHRESDSEDRTPDRGNLGIRTPKLKAQHQDIVRRQDAKEDFKSHDFAAFGNLLAYMKHIFFASVSYDQLIAYDEFCGSLISGQITSWPQAIYRFKFVYDPALLVRDAERLLFMADGSPKIVRLPCSSPIFVGEAVQQIIDTTAFQRLRGIRQLSFCDWQFPGATHSRLEHSLGVYGIAKKCLDMLVRDPNIRDRFVSRNITTALLAALVHDIGHYPFAHVIEHYIASRYSGDTKLRDKLHHFNNTLHLLDRDTALRKTIESFWGGDTIEQLPLVLTGQMGALSRLLDFTVDCDKIDYLMRDSHHCGVPYGEGFNADEIISSFLCSPDGAKLYIDEEMTHAIEGFVITQDQMLSGVYWHQKVRVIFAMFHRFIDAIVGKDVGKLISLVEQLKGCYSEHEAASNVLLPLVERIWKGKANTDQLRIQLEALIGLHAQASSHGIYRPVAKYTYRDQLDPKLGATKNIFKDLVSSLEDGTTSGPPIDWNNVRRLRASYLAALREKRIEANSLDVLSVCPESS